MGTQALLQLVGFACGMPSGTYETSHHPLVAQLMSLVSSQQEPAALSASTVTYVARDGTQMHINQCTDTAFATYDIYSGSNPDPTRTVIDVNLNNIDAMTYIRTGPATFRRCVNSQAVLAEGDNDFTPAVIETAAAAVRAGEPYTSPTVSDVCRHHVRRCFMLEYSRSLNETPPPTATATAAYDIDVGWQGQTYRYSVQMRHCGPNLDGSLEFGSDGFRQCFLHTTPLANEAFVRNLQSAESGNKVVETYGRYAWLNEIVCQKQLYLCNAATEHERLSPGCKAVVPKCQGALKHLELMLFRTDPNEQQVRVPPFSLNSHAARRTPHAARLRRVTTLVAALASVSRPLLASGLVQCNNFALKSMRGFFHDVMTSDVDGSILWELDGHFNQGMCKWSQYINALSDTTGCDPGSIIAMAGQLGFKACGIDVWQEGGEGRFNPTHIGRGYECKANHNPMLFKPDANGIVRCMHVLTSMQQPGIAWPLSVIVLPTRALFTCPACDPHAELALARTDALLCSPRSHACAWAGLYSLTCKRTSAVAQMQKAPEFDDLELSSNSTAMERFWWSLQGHFNPPTANLFYSTQAWAQSHAVGRVTCPITGHVAVDGRNPHRGKKKVTIKPGFFAAHVRDPLVKGRDNLWSSAQAATRFLGETQCDTATAAERQQCLDDIAQRRRPYPNAGGASSPASVCALKPTDGTRRSGTESALATNLNTVSGVCDLPEHFHQTI